MKSIYEILLIICVKSSMMFKNLKEDERGLSGVVVTVLLILVSVLAVVALWGLLGPWLQDLWQRIISESQNIE